MRLFRAAEPDLVLLDLLMPDMDGPSFLQVVRLYLRMQSLPVVVLTGFSRLLILSNLSFMKEEVEKD